MFSSYQAVNTLRFGYNNIDVALRRAHVTVAAMEKLSITYSECVFVVLGK
jgi:hypothetical protein